MWAPASAKGEEKVFLLLFVHKKKNLALAFSGFPNTRPIGFLKTRILATPPASHPPAPE
jgi:hypothetical protein